MYYKQSALTDVTLQWPMPNIKVERNEEASMNHILKDVRKLSIAQESL